MVLKWITRKRVLFSNWLWLAFIISSSRVDREGGFWKTMTQIVLVSGYRGVQLIQGWTNAVVGLKNWDAYLYFSNTFLGYTNFNLTSKNHLGRQSSPKVKATTDLLESIELLIIWHEVFSKCLMFWTWTIWPLADKDIPTRNSVKQHFIFIIA